MFKHAQGLKIRTRVTKMKGIIISRSDNLYGCNRYYIQPEINKDGKHPDGYWTDEDDIEVIGKGVSVKKPKEKKKRGGPMSRER